MVCLYSRKPFADRCSSQVPDSSPSKDTYSRFWVPRDTSRDCFSSLSLVSQILRGISWSSTLPICSSMPPLRFSDGAALFQSPPVFSAWILSEAHPRFLFLSRFLSPFPVPFRSASPVRFLFPSRFPFPFLNCFLSLNCSPFLTGAVSYPENHFQYLFLLRILFLL